MNVIRYTCVNLFVISFTAIYCSDDEDLPYKEKRIRSLSADMDPGIFNQGIGIDQEYIDDPEMNPKIQNQASGMFNPGIFNPEIKIGSEDIDDPGIGPEMDMGPGMGMNPGMEMFAPEIGMNSGMEMFAPEIEMNPGMGMNPGMKPLIGRIGIRGPKNQDIKISDPGLEKPADDTTLIKTVNTDLKKRDKDGNLISFDLEDKKDKKPEGNVCCYFSDTSG